MLSFLSGLLYSSRIREMLERKRLREGWMEALAMMVLRFLAAWDRGALESKFVWTECAFIVIYVDSESRPKFKRHVVKCEEKAYYLQMLLKKVFLFLFFLFLVHSCCQNDENTIHLEYLIFTTIGRHGLCCLCIDLRSKRTWSAWMSTC